VITKPKRPRFWIEVAFAALAAVLAVVTLIDADWIEWLTGTSPDGGNGSLEWLIAGGCALASLISGALARLEWQRARMAT
jgi:hypothetical protein